MQNKLKGKQSVKSSQTKQWLKYSKPRTALKKQIIRKGTTLCGVAEKWITCDSELMSDEDNAVCPECGMAFTYNADGFWICFNVCDHWFDSKCTTASSTDTVPDHYFVGAAFSNDYCSFLSDQFMQLN